MKKILLTIAICFIFTMGVAANSGSAIIPEFRYFRFSSQDYGSTNIHISNITTELIDVEILLYKSDGTLLKENSSFFAINNLLNFDCSSAKNTMQFSLDANQSGRFDFHPSSLGPEWETGYGIIKWSQDSTAVLGLIARGIIYRYFNTYGFSELSINQGQPF